MQKLLMDKQKTSGISHFSISAKHVIAEDAFLPIYLTKTVDSEQLTEAK